MADGKAVSYESGEEAQYDATAKLLLSQKPFLANIVVRTVKEFMGMDPKDVEKLIEGDPSVSEVPVDPGFTNTGISDSVRQLTGMNTEDNVRNEGWGHCFYQR